MSGLLNTLSDLHQQHREGRRGHRHDDDDDDDDRRHYGRSPQRQSHQQEQGQGRDHRQSYEDRGYGSSPGGYAPPPGPPPSSYQRDDRYDDQRGHGYSSGAGGAGYAPPSGPPPSSYQRDDRYDDQRGHGYSSGAGGGGYAPPPGPPSSYVRRDEDSRWSQTQTYRDPPGDRDREQERGYGEYAPPPGPPRVGHGSLGGLDRGDFASDADIDRMVSSGEFDERRPEYRGAGAGYGSGGRDRDAYDLGGRQGYDERAGDRGRYDTPSGPPPGRGYQGERSEQGYGGAERPSQYGSPQTQGRAQYDAPQGKRNAPAGGFSASRDEGNKYGSGEPPRRGEAAGYYNQEGQDDRYAHLAGLAKEQGVDPELCRRATAGLQQRIEAQQSRPPRKDDDDRDYKSQVDAHRKAYGDDDDGPMSNDAIGAAAAMEAIKQTATASKTPAGSKAGGPTARPGKAAREEEEEEEAGARGGGGLQDKLMAMAMSKAGKLFDKKSGGAGKPEDKAQAMQSAAATAMQLFGKYKAGKLDSGDMASVMSLAMKML